MSSEEPMSQECSPKMEQSDEKVEGNIEEVEGNIEKEEKDEELVPIGRLPDELLENIFARISPYDDLDNVKAVCRRWNQLAQKVVGNLRRGFEKSFYDGRLKCETISTVYDAANRLAVPWISERFGHMCCYYDRAIYVIGGTTHTPTTFNDMWKFDLSTRAWCRCVTGGKYPTPKALASVIQYKDNFVLFGGWAHPPPYPLMQPWRIFDELHMYNIPTKRWSQIVSTRSPHPCAGHSASVHGDLMVVFGGRTFNQREQSYPISNSVWVFNFLTQDWYEMRTNEPPQPRYGQTQITMDDSHALVIGGCGGPNQIFSDVWLLEFRQSGHQFVGTWAKMNARNVKNPVPHDFHYSGCKVGNSIVFCERSSPVSPFLAFLHFDNSRPPGCANPPDNLVFEATRSRSYFHSRCSSGLRQQTTATMAVYTLDISKVLSEGTIDWTKEPERVGIDRPKERLLYSMVAGRAELIIFGGFFKDPNGMTCRVSNDVFILRTPQKSY